jgi:hypothetical protein
MLKTDDKKSYAQGFDMRVAGNGFMVLPVNANPGYGRESADILVFAKASELAEWLEAQYAQDAARLPYHKTGSYQFPPSAGRVY